MHSALQLGQLPDALVTIDACGKPKTGFVGDEKIFGVPKGVFMHIMVPYAF